MSEQKPTEQEQILGEVKQQLDEKKRNAVKKFVTDKLKEIQAARTEIENIKQAYKDDIAEQEEAIKKAEEAIKAIESGDFEEALKPTDKLTDLPITRNWAYADATYYSYKIT